MWWSVIGDQFNIFIMWSNGPIRARLTFRAYPHVSTSNYSMLIAATGRCWCLHGTSQYLNWVNCSTVGDRSTFIPMPKMTWNPGPKEHVIHAVYTYWLLLPEQWNDLIVSWKVKIINCFLRTVQHFSHQSKAKKRRKEKISNAKRPQMLTIWQN